MTKRLPDHYGVDPLTDIQVFAPVYKGALGIDALNTRLRHALNSRGEPVLGGRLRIGDKLMLSGRNLHELGLMNGTVLRLIALGQSDKEIAVALGITRNTASNHVANIRAKLGASSRAAVAALAARDGLL